MEGLKILLQVCIYAGLLYILSVHRKEIKTLWELNESLFNTLHDVNEELRIAAARLKRLEDDGK